MSILQAIAFQSGHDLRLAAMYLRLKRTTIIIATIYLHSSEGLSDRNHSILQQLYLLHKAIALPFVCWGDFQVTPMELEESGWPQQMRAFVRTSSLASSTTQSRDRHIDMCVFSRVLEPIVGQVDPILNVPWGPHFGMSLKIASRPRSIVGPVVVVPRPLPFAEFEAAWSQLNRFEQLSQWRAAQSSALEKLTAAKNRTGVAILGHLRTDHMSN